MKDQIQSSSLIKWHVRVVARENGLHLNPGGYIITSYVIQSRWFAKMVLEKIPLQILTKKILQNHNWQWETEEKYFYKAVEHKGIICKF